MLLWRGHAIGARMTLALRPVEIGFWIGFALPIPPVLALVRLLLLVAGWSALRRSMARESTPVRRPCRPSCYGTSVRDTNPVVERLILDGYRRMSGEQRLERALALGDAVRRIALAGIRSRHPGISEREARLRLASLTMDRETLVRACGWDPEVHGYG